MRAIETTSRAPAVAFTASHRGGSGSPLVCLHGFADTWRVWELVLPVLERHHDVLATTLPGHAGGPPLPDQLTWRSLTDAVARTMDAAGFETAHLVGNSLGGYVALALAACGRAKSVVALAPAGGWLAGDPAIGELLAFQARMQREARAVAAHADSIAATAEGRRRATSLITNSFEHIPAELIAHQTVGVAACKGAQRLLAHGMRSRWSLRDERIACPVRIIWGTADKLLPWPSAAARYRNGWLAQADWIQLEDVGHCPQLDVPLETAELIVSFTDR
jgi:pimeloyl-ACP methyl ester carboxylesterase